MDSSDRVEQGIVFSCTTSRGTRIEVQLMVCSPHILRLKMCPDLELRDLESLLEIKDDHARVKLLIYLAPIFQGLPTAVLITLWTQVQAGMFAHYRPNALADIRLMSLAVAKLGGAEAITETIRAIQDVGRWWP